MLLKHAAARLKDIKIQSLDWLALMPQENRLGKSGINFQSRDWQERWYLWLKDDFLAKYWSKNRVALPAHQDELQTGHDFHFGIVVQKNRFFTFNGKSGSDLQNIFVPNLQHDIAVLSERPA